MWTQDILGQCIGIQIPSCEQKMWLTYVHSSIIVLYNIWFGTLSDTVSLSKCFLQHTAKLIHLKCPKKVLQAVKIMMIFQFSV